MTGGSCEQHPYLLEGRSQIGGPCHHERILTDQRAPDSFTTFTICKASGDASRQQTDQ
jgi:hypothetical protein